MQICITVDIEFSIGGAFAAPDREQPIGLTAVTCAAAGREHGLGFVLDTLRSFGLSATFFVEALNSFYKRFRTKLRRFLSLHVRQAPNP